MRPSEKPPHSPRGKNLEILFLGGCGEFGLNCTLFSYGEEILVVDAGLMFPEEDFLGVDFLIPDIQYLFERSKKVRGIVIHTADFKIDQTPVDGRLFDFPRLGQFGDEGVLALLGDSTNAERPGFTPSERRVGECLEPILRHSPGRVVVATFASHIHRIQQILDIAAAQKKKVCLVGRSVLQYTRVAERRHYLSVPAGILVEPKAASKIAPDRLGPAVA